MHFNKIKVFLKARSTPGTPPGRRSPRCSCFFPRRGCGKGAGEENLLLFFLWGGVPPWAHLRSRRQHPALNPAPQPESFRPPCLKGCLKGKSDVKTGPGGHRGHPTPRFNPPTVRRKAPPERLQGSSKRFSSKRDPGEPPEEGRGGVEPPQSSPASSAVDGEEPKSFGEQRGGGGSSSSPGTRAALPLGERRARPDGSLAPCPSAPPPKNVPRSLPRLVSRRGAQRQGSERGYGFSLSQGCRMVRMERTEEARPHSPTKAGLLR